MPVDFIIFCFTLWSVVHFKVLCVGIGIRSAFRIEFRICLDLLNFLCVSVLLHVCIPGTEEVRRGCISPGTGVVDV